MPSALYVRCGPLCWRILEGGGSLRLGRGGVAEFYADAAGGLGVWRSAGFASWRFESIPRVASLRLG